MTKHLLRLYLLGRWRMLLLRCPACNGDNWRRHDCYVCLCGYIKPRFRWARYLDCVNP